MNLNIPDYYFNRELSWLEFNERVLEEAQDKNNPLLERLKFLAITSSNLDEFFMVRVSGLYDQVEAGYKKKDAAGLSASEQLSKISEKVHTMTTRQYSCLTRSILPQLEKKNFFFLEYKDLKSEQKKFIKEYFNSIIYPILTPMAIDQSRPFPLLLNKSLNLIVQLDKDAPEDLEELYAVVQVPNVVSRIIELPNDELDDKKEYILLENVIKKFAGQLFQGHTVNETYAFRITRDSDLLIDEEEAIDILIEIENSVKRRKWGAPVRLEIEKHMDNRVKKFLTKTLELDKEDVYEVAGPIDLTMWFAFTSISGFEDLKNKPLPPQPVADFINEEEDIYAAIRNKDILVYHPYQSFDCVIDFIKTSASDPEVLAIKQTLYRVSGNSPIVAALILAAENGKQVTVLVELKARFDEENNINWARKLEKAGCHVIYGLVGLKTHCKICLVVRKEYDGIRRYVHLSTGNYNDNTAKIYTDHGLFTCKETFGSDISGLFNVLTGYSQPPQFRKIAVAPINLRQTLLRWIENEIEFIQNGLEGSIIAKMNSLVDTELIQAFYKASMAGVKVSLIVRGICCLKSGVLGISENITVISVVDRFLEHSRIFYFGNGGNPKVYLSSADVMPRNLNTRVEIAFPIDDEDIKQQIVEHLYITLNDTVKTRIQQQNGTYIRVDRRGKEYLHSQYIFHQMALESYNKVKESNETELFIPIVTKD